MSNQKCETCKFWSGPTHIVCRRYPPIPGRQWKEAMPRIQGTGWCGEWAAAAKTESFDDYASSAANGRKQHGYLPNE